MAENWKHLYEQMKKMVAMYQDEIVPGLRKQVEELEAKIATDNNVGSKWISVNDPPKADGRYLVRNEYGMIYDLDYKSLYRGFGEKNEFDDGTDYFMQDLGVTHWMSLPEPPKGE